MHALQTVLLVLITFLFVLLEKNNITFRQLIQKTSGHYVDKILHHIICHCARFCMVT